jgi:uncharacterized ferredoxin-like protein
MIRFGIFALLTSLAFHASAEFNKLDHLNTGGQSKVNRVMAQSYMQKSAQEVRQDQSIVNIGSRRAGTCIQNIGVGTKDVKEIILNAKEIINVCGR